MAEEKISLNKYISATGYCSRREADKLIEQGRVSINENVALPGARVNPGDKVFIDDELLKVKPASKNNWFIMAFNKPVNITSTTDEKDRSNIIRYINHPKRIFPIGRLDKDSEGLIFLTNNGDIVNKILRAGNEHEKEYIVTVDKKLTPDFAAKMSKGVHILGTTTLPCKVRTISSKTFSIILTQGLNRQIRRMCEVFGYEVVSLKRIRIMHIKLGNLAVGKWRYLSEPEMQEMMKMLEGSRNEQ
ncbi:ribosomal large subunit pseudouridine synthase F [Lacibacter cauensis]|uniref:Pseudouridine synthase n=1 Tax=Lacibacter cauensis TaxID=510947 RepID=A0A562SQG3_9BACT|nr:23S rRNA pseudouridine(2604) synthase RluF [Lacibacter cauensis]TWI83499.1 ribosomal large subunit pseudouridine synthase F [Lacibacter cauensis]